MKHTNYHSTGARKLTLFVRIFAVLAVTFCLTIGEYPVIESGRVATGTLPLVETAGASGAYVDLSLGNFSFTLDSSNTNLITANDNWAAVASVEGYFGQNLTSTHGVDPQTVVASEFASLPSSANTQVNANKGNPSAYNAGGLTEFDSGPFISLGLQGNVQGNPYLVFYINTLNRSSVSISYEVTDIDGGSNSSVSPLALQYRVGQTGNFTNVPAAFIPDATDGPSISGRVTTRSVLLPPAVSNQAQVQIRLITTNAANSTGGPTSDEWIGINNVLISSLGPLAAQASVQGRVMSPRGPVSRAMVRMTDNNGGVMTAVTNPFGYYRFPNALVGSTYILEVASKGYAFDPRVVVVHDDIFDLDFTALE